MRKMFPLIVLLLHVSAVCSDSHSLRYYTTAVSGPGSGLPEYSEVGYVDDREIVNYNTESGRMIPKVKWMEKVEPGYWEDNTQRAKGNEAIARHNVKTVMNRFNQTGGFHIVQRMYGCERRDDGVITGYYQYGYDGGEFLALDTQTWTYTPTMSQAQISTQRLNSPEEQEGERQKSYLEIICIDWLQKYVENGREDLERREPGRKPGKLSVWVIPVVIAVVVIVLAVLGIGGFLLYKRKKAGYKTTSTSDTSSSDASDNGIKA